MKRLVNPVLYEINTRVWINQFGQNATLADIPKTFFDDLEQKGINIVWLMGAWKTCTDIINKCCFQVDLISAYYHSLPDWKNSDVIGSPYSIDEYMVNSSLGGSEALKIFRNNLNEKGILLFLDFVPNHFGASSGIIKSNPEVFLQGDDNLIEKDPHTYYIPANGSGQIFAHARDPLFPAWTDTIQVNYFSSAARSFMIETLKSISEMCDGVRCDMAMLPLNNTFNNTWIGALSRQGIQKPKTEFWTEAITEVKKQKPDHIFLGEAYWDLEYTLQQQGFDYTYDKRLTDRLSSGDLNGIKLHLRAEKSFQEKCMRFIENHDEPRASSKFGEQKSLAAATVISTIAGMKLFHDGQFEGKKVKLPVQLGREPIEKQSESIKKYYRKLLAIINSEVFRFGEWKLMEALPASNDNFSFENILVWSWQLNNELRIIAVNYSAATSQCRLKFSVEHKKDDIKLIDLLSNDEYIRSCDEIKNTGLFVELKSYHSHIFDVRIEGDFQITF
ncbi:MAG: glycosidase [Ignavibacteriales bacterium]|nr:MAG: glycosidase [Ignavibacteriales bacterium]